MQCSPTGIHGPLKGKAHHASGVTTIGFNEVYSSEKKQQVTTMHCKGVAFLKLRRISVKSTFGLEFNMLRMLYQVNLPW